MKCKVSADIDFCETIFNWKKNQDWEKIFGVHIFLSSKSSMESQNNKSNEKLKYTFKRKW